MATYVKFYKKELLMFGDSKLVEVEFTCDSDDFNDAWEEALKRGHDPFKKILMKHV